MSPPSNGWLVVVFAAVVVVRMVCLDSMYEGCEPRQCGKLNISYPFWIVNDYQDTNNSVCGYRGFDIRCIDEQPIYRTSRAQYTIKNIAYDNDSFQVVDLQVLDSSCPKPTQNYSFDRSAVDFGPYHVNLHFFYGCHKSSPLVNLTTFIELPCDRNTSYVSFVGLIMNSSRPDWLSNTQCETFVSAPVELEERQMNSTIEEVNYAGLLKAGFTLRWTGLFDCGRCRRSGGRCGYDHENQTSICFCPDRPHALDCHDVTSHAGRFAQPKTLIISLTSISTVILVGAVMLLWRNSRSKQRGRPRKNSTLLETAYRLDEQRGVWKGHLKPEDAAELPFYSFDSIVLATNNFDITNKLGQGGFGSVYKGNMNDGREVAVKRLASSSNQGIEEFKNEVILISKLQHRNLVRLIGWCIEREEQILVYEYLPNKSLDKFLFDAERKAELGWSTRLSIIQGVARALVYLHKDSTLRIIHRDLKASNILLDDKMNPKISDFGLARMFQGTRDLVNTRRVVGTLGYMSPEYAMGGVYSEKSDVYSFGVLLLEIVSGKKSTSLHLLKDHVNLLSYAWELWSGGTGMDLVDDTLCEFSAVEAMRCIQVGLLCVQDHATDRPNMTAVVLMLSGEFELSPPKRPAFTFRSIEIQSNQSSIPSTNSVTNSTLVEGR